MTQPSRRERGATAVEFALVVPVLLVLVLGIMEFGRVYYFQTVLSGAAREGVRVMALQNNAASARTATKAAAVGVTLTDAQIAVGPSTCAVTGLTAPPNATVTITYPMSYITKFFGSSITLTGRGVMLCNG
jgi:Flp pilus assembly protein TadG